MQRTGLCEGAFQVDEASAGTKEGVLRLRGFVEGKGDADVRIGSQTSLGVEAEYYATILPRMNTPHVQLAWIASCAVKRTELKEAATLRMWDAVGMGDVGIAIVLPAEDTRDRDALLRLAASDPEFRALFDTDVALQVAHLITVFNLHGMRHNALNARELVYRDNRVRGTSLEYRGGHVPVVFVKARNFSLASSGALPNPRVAQSTVLCQQFQRCQGQLAKWDWFHFLASNVFLRVEHGLPDGLVPRYVHLQIVKKSRFTEDACDVREEGFCAPAFARLQQLMSAEQFVRMVPLPLRAVAWMPVCSSIELDLAQPDFLWQTWTFEQARAWRPEEADEGGPRRVQTAPWYVAASDLSTGRPIVLKLQATGREIAMLQRVRSAPKQVTRLGHLPPFLLSCTLPALRDTSCLSPALASLGWAEQSVIALDMEARDARWLADLDWTDPALRRDVDQAVAEILQLLRAAGVQHNLVADTNLLATLRAGRLRSLYLMNFERAEPLRDADYDTAMYTDWAFPEPLLPAVLRLRDGSLVQMDEVARLPWSAPNHLWLRTSDHLIHFGANLSATNTLSADELKQLREFFGASVTASHEIYAPMDGVLLRDLFPSGLTASSFDLWADIAHALEGKRRGSLGAGNLLVALDGAVVIINVGDTPLSWRLPDEVWDNKLPEASIAAPNAFPRVHTWTWSVQHRRAFGLDVLRQVAQALVRGSVSVPRVQDILCDLHGPLAHVTIADHEQKIDWSELVRDVLGRHEPNVDASPRDFLQRWSDDYEPQVLRASSYDVSVCDDLLLSSRARFLPGTTLLRDQTLLVTLAPSDAEVDANLQIPGLVPPSRALCQGVLPDALPFSTLARVWPSSRVLLQTIPIASAPVSGAWKTVLRNVAAALEVLRVAGWVHNRLLPSNVLADGARIFIVNFAFASRGSDNARDWQTFSSAFVPGLRIDTPEMFTRHANWIQRPAFKRALPASIDQSALRALFMPRGTAPRTGSVIR